MENDFQAMKCRRLICVAEYVIDIVKSHFLPFPFAISVGE